MSQDPRTPLANRFVGFCFLLLVGVLALWLALELLARIWGWLVLAAVVVTAGFVGYHIFRRRFGGW